MIFKDNFQNTYSVPFRPTQQKYYCPACSDGRRNKRDRSLYINRNTLIGKCYNCERSFFELKESDNLVKEYKQPPELKTNISKSIIEWFKTRAISEASLNHLKVTSGETYMPQLEKEVNAVRFNYFKGGKLINVKHRDKNKNFKFEQDCEVTFYNFDAVYNHSKIIICEGEIDALSFIEAGLYNVVSLPNGCKNTKFINQYIFDIEKVKEWVLCLDKDEGGMQARADLIGKLGIEKCSVINTKDCKDANAYLFKYGNKALFEAYNNAEKLIEPEDVDVDYILQEAAIYTGIKTKPYKIIFGEKDYDGKVREILTSGNISMLNGKSKSRKTFALMYLVSRIMQNTPGYVSDYSNTIVMFDTEQFKHHSLRFYNRLSDIVDITGFHLYNLRAYKKEIRLQFIKQYIESQKPTLAIIDNVRDVIKNFNDIDQSDDVVTLLSNLSETTGTHILCTLHANKKDDNARGHIGSELTQKSETVFMVKTFDESNTTVISPEFCRNEKFKEMQFELIDGLPITVDPKNFIQATIEQPF
jgi:5S rRNA maturation endonuclease (ribonuclease M5)